MSPAALTRRLIATYGRERVRWFIHALVELSVDEAADILNILPAEAETLRRHLLQVRPEVSAVLAPQLEVAQGQEVACG